MNDFINIQILLYCYNASQLRRIEAYAREDPTTSGVYYLWGILLIGYTTYLRSRYPANFPEGPHWGLLGTNLCPPGLAQYTS